MVDNQKDILQTLRDHANPDNRFEYYGRKEKGDKDWRFKKNTPTTDFDLDHHLGGEDGHSIRRPRALGMDLVLPNGTTNFTIIDTDDHDGVVDEYNKHNFIVCVSLTLDELRVPHKLFRSSGGNGYHIAIVHDKAIPKSQSVAFGKALMVAAAKSMLAVHAFNGKPVKFGTGSLFMEDHHEVDVFPKTNSDHYNIAYPFFGKSVEVIVDREAVEKGKYRLIEGTTGSIRLNPTMWPEEEMQARIDKYEAKPKADVPDANTKKPARKKPGDKAERADAPDADLDDAFNCFLKDRLFDYDDYNRWKRAATIIKSAFEEGTKAHENGREKWIEWSKLSDGADDDDTLAKVWEKTTESKWADGLTFWKIAACNGYRGGSPLWSEKLDELLRMNQRWCMIKAGTSVVYMDLRDGHPVTYSSFLALTAPQKGMAARWISWVGRNFKTGVSIEPPDYEGPMYNAWRGFQVEPVQGDVQPFKEYLARLSGFDNDVQHWITSYIADMIQNPWHPGPGTALVLRGAQGSGKSTLAEILRQIIGPDHALLITDGDRLVNRFNDVLLGKVLVQVEEAIFSGSTKLKSALKAFITDPMMTFEPKGLGVFQAKNVCRLIATTNDTHSTNIDNDDRRWTIIEVSPHDWGPEDWLRFRTWEAENRPAILHYLMTYSVDREFLRKPLETAAKAEERVQSDPLTQFLLDVAITGVIPGDYEGKGQITSARLKQEVDKVAGYARGKVDQGVLSQKLRKDHPCIDYVKNVTNWNYDKTLRTPREDEHFEPYWFYMPVRLSRARGLQFPPLGEFRAHLADLLKMDVPHDGEEWGNEQPPTPLKMYADDRADIDEIPL